MELYLNDWRGVRAQVLPESRVSLLSVTANAKSVWASVIASLVVWISGLRVGRRASSIRASVARARLLEIVPAP